MTKMQIQNKSIIRAYGSKLPYRREKKTTAETSAQNAEKHKTLESTGSLNSNCSVVYVVVHSIVESTLRYRSETGAYASG